LSAIFRLIEAHRNEIRAQPAWFAANRSSCSPRGSGTRGFASFQAHLCIRRLSHLTTPLSCRQIKSKLKVVVLFDEPTSSLDPELVGEVLSVMRDLADEALTMVVVTHEMSFAQKAAREIVFLDRGTVIETGTPEPFFKRPSTDRVRQFLQRYK
jgi:predicted ATPase